MHNQHKILRVLQLIALLKKSPAKSIKNIASILSNTDRTIYRYLDLIKELGFDLQRDAYNKYFIVCADTGADVGFTKEEAQYLTSLLKTAGKATIVGALPIMILEAVFGAISETIRSIGSGDSIGMVIRKAIVGAISGPIQGIVDLIGFFFDIPEIKIADEINGLIDSDIFSKTIEKTKIFTKRLYDDLSKSVVGIFDFLYDIGSSIVSNILWTLEAITRDIVNNPLTRKLGIDKLLLPLVSSLFNSPESGVESTNINSNQTGGIVTPVNRSSMMASSLIAGQNNINDAEMLSTINSIGSKSGMPGNSVMAPVNVVNNSTNMINQRINTRNPESDLYKSILGY
jgi:hypothetical protein